jgi:hypothetical protein
MATIATNGNSLGDNNTALGCVFAGVARLYKQPTLSANSIVVSD